MAVTVFPGTPDTAWINELSDEECMEVFWLYVDPPEPFLNAHPAPLLGAAMRHALRLIVADQRGPA
ncbi:MAG TPA: hypothetical protein VGI92_01980 [Gemmatimonadales bacterium]|jgi:hypothetical protein